MEDILAYCGLLCNKCPAYIATVQNDDELRKKTATEWKAYGADISPEDINCLGCKSDVLFSHCKICEIRTCSSGKALNNCGTCSSFSCDKVEGVLKHSPDARERLLNNQNQKGI